MFIRKKIRKNNKVAIQIVENVRRDGKVQQKVLRHIGQAENEMEEKALINLGNAIIDELKYKHQQKLPFYEPEKLPNASTETKAIEDKVNICDLREEQRINDGIRDIFGKLFDDLGFGESIKKTRNNKQWNNILKACVFARIANPASKNRTASMLEDDYGIKIPLEKIYRMMDHVTTYEEEIKAIARKATLSIFKQKVEVCYFDVTTLYFESFCPDELRRNGYSKDAKFKETQVVLALITTSEGLPIDYRLFPGDMFEGHTLIEVTKELQKDFDIKSILLVADRGMFNKDNLKYMDENGINYIVAAKLKTLKKEFIEEILSSINYKGGTIKEDFIWHKEINYNGKRLIISYSSKRARKDASDRQKIVEKLLKKFKNKKISLKQLIPNSGTKKYIDVKGSKAIINQEKIDSAGQWDGIHGVITNSIDENNIEILKRYRGLWQIEEAFRVSKHDLKLRPMFHWSPDRIKAHVCICFISYTLIKQALYRLKLHQENISFPSLRNELLHAQSSLLLDISTNNRYLLPSQITTLQKKIYRVFGLSRSSVPIKINNIMKL